MAKFLRQVHRKRCEGLKTARVSRARWPRFNRLKRFWQALTKEEKAVVKKHMEAYLRGKSDFNVGA